MRTTKTPEYNVCLVMTEWEALAVQSAIQDKAEELATLISGYDTPEGKVIGAEMVTRLSYVYDRLRTLLDEDASDQKIANVRRDLDRARKAMEVSA